jgi:hypothetical protein
MISETIESDATPESETPKTRRKAARKAKQRRSGPQQRRRLPRTRNAPTTRPKLSTDEVRQRGDVDRDYESRGLAGAHRTRSLGGKALRSSRSLAACTGCSMAMETFEKLASHFSATIFRTAATGK